MTGKVRVMNLRPEARDITLVNGTNLRLGPRIKDSDRHISEPISKRLLPPPVEDMVKRKEIRLIEEE